MFKVVRVNIIFLYLHILISPFQHIVSNKNSLTLMILTSQEKPRSEMFSSTTPGRRDGTTCQTHDTLWCFIT